MSSVRSLAMGAIEALTFFVRRLSLRLCRHAGSAYRRTSRGSGPLVRWLAAVALGLLLAPPLINAASALVGTLHVWHTLAVEKPHVGDWWSVERVLGIAAAILAMRWFLRARERVVVEQFVDYTNDDAKAVGGLATLLVTELSRLRELYGRVNDQLSTPMSVGVPGHGGGPATEPGEFLSVRADDLTEVLNGAVAAESKVEVMGISIPIGLPFALLGRVARGPRVIGSVHYTASGGGPTLTAQVIGRGRSHQWRIDAPQGASDHAVDKAFLDPMVTEAACRMFTDLTLRGSVRWRAIRAFTSYLELYWESLNTPKDRASKLERAGGHLLEAVAQDETFDLAYYNLGVVYSQLAQAELAAAQASEYVKSDADPGKAHAERTDAALAAFNRAVALNRDRWEAIYAIGVHEFARVERHAATGASDAYDLEYIVCRCERVLDLDRCNAQAHDLKGMVQVRQEKYDAALRSHRRAVAHSWRGLRRAEFAERAKPPTSASPLPGARANAAAALHNLAAVHAIRARAGSPRVREVRRRRADRFFRQALALAPTSTRAATLCSQGACREKGRDPARAIECYAEAIKIEPDRPLYWAYLARASAKGSADKDPARHAAASALNTLAPVYRRSLELHPPPGTISHRNAVLDTLAEAFGTIGAHPERGRMLAIKRLATAIEEATVRGDVAALDAMKRSHFGSRTWEREQIEIALARTCGKNGDWRRAADEYGAVVETLRRYRPAAIQQHALHAKHAKALRRAGDLHEALAAAARGQVQNPLSATARRELGAAHFALLQFEQALEAWRHTIWLTPNDPYLHWKVAFCHWNVAQDRRDPERRRDALLDAAAGFEQAAMLFGIRAVSGWPWSELWAGRVREELGEHDAAIAHLRAARGCAPTELAGHLFLGETYTAAGETWLGRCELARVLELAGMLVRGHVDAEWGETLTYRELRARAKAGLGRWTLATEPDGGAAVKLAEESRELATQISDPRARERTMTRTVALERLLRSRGVVVAAAPPSSNGNGAGH
jgi:tetratricopeptide (TPR) repeat protein